MVGFLVHTLPNDIVCENKKEINHKQTAIENPHWNPNIKNNVFCIRWFEGIWYRVRKISYVVWLSYLAKPHLAKLRRCNCCEGKEKTTKEYFIQNLSPPTYQGYVIRDTHGCGWITFHAKLYLSEKISSANSPHRQTGQFRYKNQLQSRRRRIFSQSLDPFSALKFVDSAISNNVIGGSKCRHSILPVQEFPW